MERPAGRGHPAGGRSTPVVSVVVPARDAATTIGRQLDALAEQSVDGAWEVVVADNGSTDRTAAVARAHRLGRLVPVRVVDASRRPGVNVARNVGVAAAEAPIVVLCDADDEVADGWLAAHLGAFAHTGVDLTAGPLDVDALGQPARRWGSGLPRPAVLAGIPCGWGANLGFRRELWSRLGGFDETFVRGFDEIDFVVRAHVAGCPLWWVDAAVVRYRVPSTAVRGLRKQLGSGRGSVRLAHRHPELGAAPGTRRALVRAGRLAVRLPRPVPYEPLERRALDLAYELGALVELVWGPVAGAWRGAADRLALRPPGRRGRPASSSR